METITMAEVLYVPIDERGEPHRWETAEEVTVTVFGDFWRARRDVQSKGRAIRAVSAEELRGLLEGRWGDVTHLSYHPSADAYIMAKDTAFANREE